MIKQIIEIKFKAIDTFNRPVYKHLHSGMHFGSTETLYSHHDNKKDIDAYFKENMQEL